MPKFKKKYDVEETLLAHKKRRGRCSHPSVRNHVSSMAKCVECEAHGKPKRNITMRRVASAVLENRTDGSILRVNVYQKVYNNESVSIHGAIKTLKSGSREDLKNYENLMDKYQFN